MRIDDPYQFPPEGSIDEEFISIMPDWRYIPSGDFGAYDLPPVPDYPAYNPPPVEHFDSRDYSGAANYYYVEPAARTTTNYNYYASRDRGSAETGRNHASLASLLASQLASMPPVPKSTSLDEQVKMMQQAAAMYEARQRFDAQQRELRMLRLQMEAESRFGNPGPPQDYPSQRLLNSPVNRDYMRDFYEEPPIIVR